MKQKIKHKKCVCLSSKKIIFFDHFYILCGIKDKENICLFMYRFNFWLVLKQKLVNWLVSTTLVLTPPPCRIKQFEECLLYIIIPLPLSCLVWKKVFVWSVEWCRSSLALLCNTHFQGGECFLFPVIFTLKIYSQKIVLGPSTNFIRSLFFFLLYLDRNL